MGYSSERNGYHIWNDIALVEFKFGSSIDLLGSCFVEIAIDAGVTELELAESL